jgi:hypothetical protein
MSRNVSQCLALSRNVSHVSQAPTEQCSRQTNGSAAKQVVVVGCGGGGGGSKHNDSSTRAAAASTTTAARRAAAASTTTAARRAAAASTIKKMEDAIGTNEDKIHFCNKSIDALNDVVNARCQFDRSVPYRNSTLTHLLRDSLEADAKVLLLCCVGLRSNEASTKG